MKKLIVMLVLVFALFSTIAFSQDPISNMSDEARNKIVLNEKAIKIEKSEIEKHQTYLSNLQSENSKLKKVLKKITPELVLNQDTKVNATDDIKNKIIINDNSIKDEKTEITKHEKYLTDFQKENRNLKNVVKEIKKL